ncbi:MULTISPECIES: NAD(P)H:quinone oxidoreductase [Cobetia]|uniref:NAD(P)H:quinone oxidoreductase n=1 Tax=Cobetia TaxID=204286 RepID=UPI00103F2852|nr:NAD(P)H:quinone oxidoreductase [Halomonas sp. GDM18]
MSATTHDATPYVLVLYYSRHGATRTLAEQIAAGIESISGVEARLRRVPEISATCEQTEPEIPDSGAMYVELDDLRHCSGLALGSPTRFGNMAAPLKYFLDSTSELWMNGALIDKPATAFSASSSLHGGQETTLITMLIPLLHHGMVYAGVPYSATELLETTQGGTPYGTTHVSGKRGDNDVDDNEQRLALAQGKRIARLALAMQPLRETK